jgi:hypothetical protein
MCTPEEYTYAAKLLPATLLPVRGHAQLMTQTKQEDKAQAQIPLRLRTTDDVNTRRKQSSSKKSFKVTNN